MHRRAALIALTAALLIALAGAPRAAEPSGPATYVSSLADEVVAVFASGVDTAARRHAFERLVARNVDVDRLVPYLVGESWGAATPGERLSLKSAYRWYAARIYSRVLIDRFVDGYAITNVDHRDDGRITVITKVHSRYDPRDVSYAWTVVRYRDSGFRIFDVSEAGRSLAEAVRKDCREIIARDGVQGLIRSLYRAAAQP